MSFLVLFLSLTIFLTFSKPSHQSCQVGKSGTFYTTDTWTGPCECNDVSVQYKLSALVESFMAEFDLNGKDTTNSQRFEAYLTNFVIDDIHLLTALGSNTNPQWNSLDDLTSTKRMYPGYPLYIRLSDQRFKYTTSPVKYTIYFIRKI